MKYEDRTMGISKAENPYFLKKKEDASRVV